MSTCVWSAVPPSPSSILCPLLCGVLVAKLFTHPLRLSFTCLLACLVHPGLRALDSHRCAGSLARRIRDWSCVHLCHRQAATDHHTGERQANDPAVSRRHQQRLRRRPGRSRVLGRRGGRRWRLAVNCPTSRTVAFSLLCFSFSLSPSFSSAHLALSCATSLALDDLNSLPLSFVYSPRPLRFFLCSVRYYQCRFMRVSNQHVCFDSLSPPPPPSHPPFLLSASTRPYATSSVPCLCVGVCWSVCLCVLHCVLICFKCPFIV